VKPPAVPGRPDGVDDTDILRVFLERVSVLMPEAAKPGLVALELELRAQYGGLRVRIPKRKKHLTAAQRQEMFQDAMSDKTDDEIADKFGVHRATLYRTIKRGVVGRRGK
jgi:DNA invertase Pin-like site-specific DNA recombinase